jgi:predicted 2-oxoglutarate/Fe(II)-dependent dioxygenase YbiX
MNKHIKFYLTSGLHAICCVTTDQRYEVFEILRSSYRDDCSFYQLKDGKEIFILYKRVTHVEIYDCICKP